MSKHRKEQKRAFVEKLQKERDARSPEEQLALLDRRLGKDQGAKKERARLKKMIAKRPKRKSA